MKHSYKESSSLIKELHDKLYSHRAVVTKYHIYPDLTKLNKPIKLLDILSIPEEILIGKAREVYEFFENNDDLDKAIQKKYDSFKWKLSAFISIQDIFDIPVVNNFDESKMFQLWYFYYESKYVLIESILCGFNGLYLSSNFLSRLFLEFNIIQNYFYRSIKIQSDYQKLNTYLKDQILPSWNVVVNGSLPKDNFCKPIKKRLYEHFKKLSKTSAHPYHPQFSPKQHSSFIPSHSMEGLFFWFGFDIVLQAILWLYYVNFPMLFQKTQVLKKFGFVGPIGIFADEQCVNIVKKTLSKTDYIEFKNYSENHEDVKMLLEWYNSLGSLTEKEILDTWDNNDGKTSSILEGYAKNMAKLRVMREIMALKKERNIIPDISELQIDNVLNYKFWKKIYKKNIK